jgi:hypothetical protein
MDVVLRHALRRDLPAIVELWVEAFGDDPYLGWIQPDDQRYEYEPQHRCVLGLRVRKTVH